MPGISSNQRAILTCRAGLARAGASRAGFMPSDVQGLTPGSQGGFYVWTRIYLPTTPLWTRIHPLS